MTASATQQLLLDMTYLNNILKGIIVIGDVQRFDDEDCALFATHVQSKSQKTECILKCILAPVETMLETYKSLCPLPSIPTQPPVPSKEQWLVILDMQRALEAKFLTSKSEWLQAIDKLDKQLKVAQLLGANQSLVLRPDAAALFAQAAIANNPNTASETTPSSALHSFIRAFTMN